MSNSIEADPTMIDDDFVISQTSSLSDGKERLLGILNVISAILSIVGSSTIIFRILQQPSKMQSYERIMLGLSSTDIVASLTFALSPFLLPSDSSQRVWAIGNDTTCSFIGWLTQFAFSAVWYNAMLAFYYLMTVRFQVTRARFAAKYELWVHISSVGYFAVTATIALIFDWYGEFQINQGCWIGEIPKGCEAAGTCTGTGQLVAYLFGGVPTAVTFLFLLIGNLMIFFFVRRTLQKTLESSSFRAESATSDRDSTIKSAASKESQTSSVTDEERYLRYQKQIKEVASQGFLFVLTFLVSYTPAAVVRVIDGLGNVDASSESSIFGLLVLNAVLLPLQGFFNMFVHTRPNYLRFRVAYPDNSVFWALRQACFNNDVPRYSESNFSVRSVNNSRSRRQPKSRSNFSSNLDIVHEGSNEEGSDDDDSMNRSLSNDDVSSPSNSFQGHLSGFLSTSLSSLNGTGKGTSGETVPEVGIGMGSIMEGSHEDSSSHGLKSATSVGSRSDESPFGSTHIPSLPLSSAASENSLEAEAVRNSGLVCQTGAADSVRRVSMDGSIQ